MNPTMRAPELTNAIDDALAEMPCTKRGSGKYIPPAIIPERDQS